MRKYYLSLIESYRSLRKASVIGLIFRMDCLHTESKQRAEDDGVPMADIREATVIVKELRRRLGIIGAFYGEVKIEK